MTSRGARMSALILVITAGWTINLTFTLIAPILPQIAAQGDAAHDGELAAELVMTAASLGVMLGMLTSAALQERLGLRRVILVSFIGAAMAGSAGFLIHNLILLAISRALLGFFGASSTAALTVLLASLVDERSRGRVLGYQQAMAGAFNVSGSLLGGWIGTLLGWRYVFLVYGVLGLASFSLALSGASDVPPPNEHTKASLFGTIAHSWPLLAVGVGVLTLTIVPYTQGGFILSTTGVTDSRVLAVMISVSALLLILSAGLYGRIRSRFSGAAIILLGALLASVGVMLMGASKTASMVALGIGMTGFAGGLVITALLHEATERDAHLRARAIGLVHACLFFGVFLNPVIIGFLRTRMPLNQAVEVWGAAGLAVAMLTGIGSRSRLRRKRAVI